MYVPMRIPVRISIHSSSYPYFAPTFELINKAARPEYHARCDQGRTNRTPP